MLVRIGRSALVATLLLVTVPATARAHPGPVLPPAIGAPSALSTSGDYATDVYGDPWDFSNDEDVPPYLLAGTEGSAGISRSTGGHLTVASLDGTNIKLVRSWGLELPWGRNGHLNPVDADVYTRFSVGMCVSEALNLGLHFWRADGGEGMQPFTASAGCATYSFNLADTSKYPFGGFQARWSGDVIRFDLFRGGALRGGNPTVDITLDWARLYRADAPASPPSGLPVPQVLSPSEEGGTDYATANGNPWDFAGSDDVIAVFDAINVNYAGGNLSGVTVANDSYVELPLRTPLVPDRFHRATVEVCYGGQMSFADAPGGGMNARFAWFPEGGPWSETQDLVIYPGCNRMTIDLATTPAVAVNDENTVFKRGWRGQKISRFRFDLNEDPGWRTFTVREIRLADDAALTSSYDIQFVDTAGSGGTTADVYVTLDRNVFNGVKVAGGISVTGGVNTFRWNGTDAQGTTLPNGTYWVYVVMKNTAGIGVNFASGPLRLQLPQPVNPSVYVPLTPARVLDTRDGTGGNLRPLAAGAVTELDLRGVGGVPRTGVTAVVMNVTAVSPTASGYLTVWPADKPRPTVSNLNFVPGQVVANLVTVRLGDDGRVAFYNFTGAVDVVVDVVGYYTDQPISGGRFNAVTPGRVLDTRDGTGRGGVIQPLAGTRSIDLQVTGVGGVPAGATAVAFNVTADAPTMNSYLTVWPSGEQKPLASSLNFAPGVTVANLVIAKIGAGGRVALYNNAGNVDVIVDVVGYFSAQGSRFVPVVPVRIVDTRDGTGGRVGALGTNEQFASVVGGRGPIPLNAGAAVMNVTSTEAAAMSYLTVWPHPEGRPTASTLNPRPGVAVPNQTYLMLGAGDAVDVYNFVGSTHVVVDVFGYMVT